MGGLNFPDQGSKLHPLQGDFGAKICHCFQFFPIYWPWSYGAGCHDLSFLNNKFQTSSFTFIKRLFRSQWYKWFFISQRFKIFSFIICWNSLAHFVSDPFESIFRFAIMTYFIVEKSGLTKLIMPTLSSEADCCSWASSWSADCRIRGMNACRPDEERSSSLTPNLFLLWAVVIETEPTSCKATFQPCQNQKTSFIGRTISIVRFTSESVWNLGQIIPPPQTFFLLLTENYLSFSMVKRIVWDSTRIYFKTVVVIDNGFWINVLLSIFCLVREALY